MKSLALLISILLFLTSCASNYSLVEQQVRSEIPVEQRNHSEGIIVTPSKLDVQAAIQLGQSSKDSEALAYAYLKKGPSDYWSKSQVYVKTVTPLYLISYHAREQAREYRDLDQDFIGFCKELNAVKLTLNQQYNNGFVSFPQKREIILLHNGKRVNTLTSIESYKGENPFSSTEVQAGSEAVRKALANVQSMANNFTMTESQLKNLETTYKSMGYSDEQIRTYMKAISYQLNATDRVPVDSSKMITLNESDNVYAISDLNKAGNYELVFRTPSTNSMLSNGDKEIRFPISFANLK